MWFYVWPATTHLYVSDRAASFMSPMFDLTNLSSRFNAGVTLAQGAFFWGVSFAVASWQSASRQDTSKH
jgi:hypothetical protein